MSRAWEDGVLRGMLFPIFIFGVSKLPVQGRIDKVRNCAVVLDVGIEAGGVDVNGDLHAVLAFQRVCSYEMNREALQTEQRPSYKRPSEIGAVEVALRCECKAGFVTSLECGNHF